MKATILITDDDGTRFRGEIELNRIDPPGSDQSIQLASVTENDGVINFVLPVRAFVKKYAASASSGAAKFTLLLARLTNGRETSEIPASEIESEWSRLTTHLGSFNRAHATRAKDRAWVDSNKTGVYRLGPLWREAFSADE
jgi:hypothetical protein